MTSPQKQEEDCEIYEYMAPTADITLNSAMYRTVPSPMAHILVDYRNLRQVLSAFSDLCQTAAAVLSAFSKLYLTAFAN